MKSCKRLVKGSLIAVGMLASFAAGVCIADDNTGACIHSVSEDTAEYLKRRAKYIANDDNEPEWRKRKARIVGYWFR